MPSMTVEILRLLLVEDSEDDAALIESALREDGFVLETDRVWTADALRASLVSGSWDLLITEYVLQGLDGPGVLEILGESGLRIPAILVSGQIGEQAAVEAMRSGARDYVSKANLARLAPVVRRELEEMVSRRERRAAESKYEVAFRSSPSSIALTSLEDGRFLEVNPAFEEITGYSRDEVLGETTLDLGIWGRTKERERFLRVLEEKGSVRDERLPVRRKDGRMRETLMSAEIVDLPEGRGILSVVRDVTAERRALLAVEQSEERFSKAFFANPNPAVITTLSDGMILEANQVLCEIAGLPRDELIGRNGVDLGLWDAEHAARMSRLLEDGRSVRDLELRAHSRRGTVHELLLSAVVVEMAGEPCVLNVAVDITESKKLQAHLLRAQRLESIGTLAGGIAHDLNNVLTPILMAIKLLRRDRPEQRERVLSILESNARRGADLIRQVLTFSRGFEGQRAPVHLGHLAREIGTIVRDTFPKSIDLQLRHDKDLWLVEGDATQFHQVLLNLAVNARDAMEGAGSLSITLHNRELDASDSASLPGVRPGRYVVIEVADTGPGIPEDVRQRVFDPFYTTKDPDQGTGLGLFTVETIVDAHGGFLEVTDSPSGGARFLVHLPVAGGRTEEVGRGRMLVPETDGRGELVLIVDDEEAVREIAAGVLEASGYRTVPAADGSVALDRFEERRPEIRVAVVDMMMPKMDGTETIRALRRLDPKLPIIAMSGIESGTAGGSGTEVDGADLFLHKPLTAEDLLGGVRAVLRGPEAAEEPSAREAR